MKLTDRHKAIIEIVKEFEPITSDEIAEKLSLGKSTLRNDLAVLGMLEVLEAKPNVGYYYNYNFSPGEQREEVKRKSVKEIMGIAITAKSTASYSEVLSKLFIYDVGTIFIVHEDELVSDALRKIILHEIDCLPVVREDDNGNRIIVGKVSKTTLIKLLLEILEG